MSRRSRLRGCVVAIALLVCSALLYMFHRTHIIDNLTFSGNGENRWFDNPAVPSPTGKKAFDILVIAYLRGGSTLLGEILGIRNDSFYVYEPLHKMAQFGYFKPGYECSMNNETCRKPNQTDDEILDVIRAIYRCDYRHYQDQLRTWQHLKSRGFESINNPKWKLSFPECNGTFDGCPEKYLSQCSNRGSIVSKVPRLSVSLASKLLDTFSNLKIIHLLRDPRAILHSRDKLKWTPVPGGAISLCKKMTDDYLESRKIKTVYPGRLYTVYYEDMATDPVETFRKIYNFAGYDFNAAEQLRLTERTASSERASAGNTYRRNSTNTARAWRDQIQKDFLTKTNKACSNLHRLLGYPQLVNPLDIKNMSIPLKMKPGFT